MVLNNGHWIYWIYLQGTSFLIFFWNMNYSLSLISLELTSQELPTV